MAEWRENQLPTPTVRPEHWVMYFDGSLNLEGAGAGVSGTALGVPLNNGGTLT
jgi:hypothetical protein